MAYRNCDHIHIYIYAHQGVCNRNVYEKKHTGDNERATAKEGSEGETVKKREDETWSKRKSERERVRWLYFCVGCDKAAQSWLVPRMVLWWQNKKPCGFSFPELSHHCSAARANSTLRERFNNRIEWRKQERESKRKRAKRKRKEKKVREKENEKRVRHCRRRRRRRRRQRQEGEAAKAEKEDLIWTDFFSLLSFQLPVQLFLRYRDSTVSRFSLFTPAFSYTCILYYVFKDMRYNVYHRLRVFILFSRSEPPGCKAQSAHEDEKRKEKI